MTETEENCTELETTNNETDIFIEYKETLHTTKKSKKKTKGKKNTGYDEEQRHWRNVKKIEQDVDNIHITRAQKPTTDLDRKVENIIGKNKK